MSTYDHHPYVYDQRSMAGMYGSVSTQPRDFGLERPSSRRQNAVKIPHRSRNANAAANGHHNHVDIGKIRQGSDVRTTVSISFNVINYI